jgi:hypothetical protein
LSRFECLFEPIYALSLRARHDRLPGGHWLRTLGRVGARDTTFFGPPNGVFGSPAFGTITTAGDPRVVQLAVKLLF